MLWSYESELSGNADPSQVACKVSHPICHNVPMCGRYLDVPLDQFSLRPLACIETLDHLNLRNASMGSGKTREQYTEIHCIRLSSVGCGALRACLMKRASVPAFLMCCWVQNP